MKRTKWKQQGQFKEHFKSLKAAAKSSDMEANHITAANLRYCLSGPIDENALHIKLETVAQYSDVGEVIDNTQRNFNTVHGLMRFNAASFMHTL